MRRIILTLFGVSTCGLAAVYAQNGIDPALLAKASAGDTAAEVQVGESYETGKGVDRDYSQAAAWYLKAADQGDVSAQGTMGMLYMLGVGVPRSDADAYFWLDLASSAQGPDQERYEINRQNVGTRITADQLDEIGQRVAAWKAKHPHRE